MGRPSDFGIGTVPIVKDNLVDVTDVNNYIGITLCPTISKPFEYCLLHKYESHTNTSDVQLVLRKSLAVRMPCLLYASV